MLLSSLIIVLAGRALAAPISHEEQSVIARHANIANDAYHPDLPFTGNRLRYLVPSLDEPGWSLTHHPDTQTLTMAFTSPDPESVLEILASSNIDDTDYLAPFPFRDNDEPTLGPMIYAPYAQFFDIFNESLSAMESYITHPPTSSSILSQYLDPVFQYLGLPRLSSPSAEIREIEIVGHGLGSVVALFSTLAIHQDHPTMEIRSTLFSMPRIGNDHFGLYVDRVLRQAVDLLDVQRVNHGRDPLPSLPPPHYGLAHPTSIPEIQLGQEGSETKGMKGKLEDGFGPYWGQCIGRVC